MPRIRKKTSKRGTTNDKRKIHDKVRESRKKKAKAAKKNVEWKSKHKKDPGIPNTFPYKDQILAEVAEQRRLAAEEKQRRKDEKNAHKSKPAAEDDPASENVDDLEGGIASISAKRLTAKATRKPAPSAQDSEDEEEIEAPILINRDLPHLQAVLEEADVVLEVLDARDPLSFRSAHLEEIASSKSGRKTLFVLNKIDCAPQEAVSAWVSTLRKHQPTFPFRSASAFIPDNPLIPVNSKGKGKTKDPVDDALGADAILECLSHWAGDKKDESPFTVAVIGVANTGKSSLINSLVKAQSLPVYSLLTSSRGPTTTIMPQELTTKMEGKTLRFVDTPGFSWDTDKTSSDADQIRARDILLRNKGRIDRLKDPLVPVAHLVSRANSEDLMLLYSLPAFPKGDIDAFISGVARSQQLVRKRGVLDLTGAAKIVLRDWCIGKIRWYSMPSTPPSNSESSSDSVPEKLESLYAKTADVLVQLELRKDMRKAGGLVKVTPGEVEERKVSAEMLYVGSEESDDEDDDEMDVDEQDAEEDEDGDEGDEDEDDNDELEEEEDDEEVVPPPGSRNQKRKRAEQNPLPPKKRVTFSTVPLGSKGTAKNPSKPKSSVITRKVIKPTVTHKRTKTVANAPSSSKSQPQTSTSSQGGGEAYDFAKYF